MTAQQARSAADHAVHAVGCPFFEVSRCVCRAALLVYQPEEAHRSLYCHGDDHDDCVLFLAKALRSSSAGGQARDVIVHSEK